MTIITSKLQAPSKVNVFSTALSRNFKSVKSGHHVYLVDRANNPLTQKEKSLVTDKIKELGLPLEKITVFKARKQKQQVAISLETPLSTVPLHLFSISGTDILFPQSNHVTLIHMGVWIKHSDLTGENLKKKSHFERIYEGYDLQQLLREINSLKGQEVLDIQRQTLLYQLCLRIQGRNPQDKAKATISTSTESKQRIDSVLIAKAKHLAKVEKDAVLNVLKKLKIDKSHIVVSAKHKSPKGGYSVALEVDGRQGYYTLFFVKGKVLTASKSINSDNNFGLGSIYRSSEPYKTLVQGYKELTAPELIEAINRGGNETPTLKALLNALHYRVEEEVSKNTESEPEKENVAKKWLFGAW